MSAMLSTSSRPCEAMGMAAISQSVHSPEYQSDIFSGSCSGIGSLPSGSCQTKTKPFFSSTGQALMTAFSGIFLA